MRGVKILGKCRVVSKLEAKGKIINSWEGLRFWGKGGDTCSWVQDVGISQIMFY